MILFTSQGKQMRFLSHLVAALGFGLLALGVSAAPDNPRSGIEYRSLDKAQATEGGDRVEVVEFFWYSCPHCNTLEPALNEWVAKQGDKILYKRVPVAFRDSMVPQQKLFYTLEAMGLIDQLHHKVFHAIHVQRKALDTEAAIVAFVAGEGVDRQKFLDVFNSFGVQSKARRASQMQQAYQVDGVPLLAVDGRYLTSPAILGASMGNRPAPVLYAATFQVLDWLVARSAKAKLAVTK
jgi:protein dithiol oxidoreductase (disulfide-forming)